MNKLRLSIFIVLVAILLLNAACTAQPTPPPSTPTPHVGKALLESRCTSCHPMTTTTTIKNDRTGWELSVRRMVDKGAQLSQQQVAQLVDYLAITYK